MTDVVANMVRTWAPDDFWQAAQPLIPIPARRMQGGGKRRADDRAVLAAIVYLVQAGCSWNKLPAMFGVSRSTVLPAGAKRGDETGPNSTDRGKPGSKIHVLCDRTGLPLTVLTSAANVPDAHLLDSLAPIRSRRGRPRQRPAKLHGDKAYDVRELRAEVRRRGIAVRIARKGVESSERLGRHRWVVEACLSWLQDNRRLVRRYDRKAEHFQAFADLGCAILAYQ